MCTTWGWHDKPPALTFQLEGELAGPWVRVLEECWQSTLARQREMLLRLDLTAVTFIDEAGQACLAAMHRRGAEFVTADCLIGAIVAEIIHAPHDRTCPNGTGKCQPSRNRGAT
jgi:hypothetical protein